MAGYSKDEAREWARERLVGAVNSTIPSFTGDLRGINETAIRHLAQEQYAFADHACRRFVEKLKDAVDPAGIFAPGKQGIWPRALRPGGVD